MTNLAPWRELAWALLHERAALLTARCREVADGDESTRADLGRANREAAKIAAALVRHVPPELLARPPA